YAVMEAALRYHLWFWRNPIVAIAFYMAVTVHLSLGLWALYQRRHFRYTVPEMTQLLLGLSIPLLIMVHFIGVRLPGFLYGREPHYANVLIGYWANRPYMDVVQYALLLVAWTHACIGIYFWVRLKPIFNRAAPFLLAV